jgi:clan AA aspartic protease
MNDGVLSAELEPLIKITLVGVAAQVREIEAAIDTGFNGHLSLPVERIESLGWLQRGEETAIFGDGRDVPMDMYRGIVLWRGNPRLIFAMAAPVTPVIGTGLLQGNRLEIEFKRGGSVNITPLP